MLAQILGSAYRVENFGKSGATAGETEGKSYACAPAYTKALTFAAHTYVVMLGTNDAWHGEPHKTEAGLTTLIQRLQEVGSVLLVMPPGIKGGRMTTNFADIVHPAIRKVAVACRIPLIEPLLLKSQEAYNPDRVHLSRAGARCLAEAVAKALEENVSTPAQATNEDDRKHILNSIAGQEDLDADPLKE